MYWGDMDRGRHGQGVTCTGGDMDRGDIYRGDMYRGRHGQGGT